MNFKHAIVVIALSTSLGLSLQSCTSQAQKDAKAKASIEASLPPGVTVEVENGVATLNGEFQDENTKMITEESIKSVEHVKSVANYTTVMPAPVINPDAELQSAVASLISSFSGVNATVNEGVIVLSGEIERTQWMSLKQALDALRPRSVDNTQLIIK